MFLVRVLCLSGSWLVWEVDGRDSGLHLPSDLSIDIGRYEYLPVHQRPWITLIQPGLRLATRGMVFCNDVYVSELEHGE